MIKFRAKSIEAGKTVEGDLATVNTVVFGKRTTKYYIVSHHANGGMIYIGIREQIDPETIQINSI